MKKIALVLACIICSVQLWAVWEGNAGVGNPLDFGDKKLTVKSDMFPRNTLLEIINLENGKKSPAIVCGSSGIAGLLVNLSPDLAVALEVPSDKIVRVRVEITNTLSDEFLSDEKFLSSDADYNPALADIETNTVENPYAETDTVLFDPASSTRYPKPKKPEITLAGSDKTAEVDPVTEKLPEEKSKNITESDVQNTGSSEKLYLEKAGLKPPKPQTQKQTVVAQAQPKTEATSAQTATKELSRETPSVPIAPANPIPEAPRAVAEVPGIIHPAKAEQNPPKRVSEVAAITRPEKESKKPAAPVDEVSSIKTPEKTKKSEAKAVTEVAGITAPKAEKKRQNTVKPVQELSAIKDLKPEELKPIKTVDRVHEKELVASEVKKNDVIIIDEPEKKIVDATKDAEVAELPPSVKAEPYSIQADSEMYHGSLQIGKYYLQIANYKNESNVKTVLARHKQYPLVVEKLGNGTKTRYRIFVGPLKADEMGATMEQFYRFGFKDSFFKVIQ